MSLVNALNIGRSALAVNQAAIQVTGNNISNAGNPDYTRQVATIVPAGDVSVGGVRIGSGIDLTAVTRQIDDALQERMRSSVSDDNAAQTTQEWLSRVESVFNELGDEDLSTKLSTFFASWSDMANKPQDQALRQIVMQNGDGLASWIRSIRQDLTGIQGDVRNRLGGLVNSADGLAKQVAELNKQISSAEGSSGQQANGLRDQRDAVLKQLSELVDIRTAAGSNGAVNVFVGSEPLVMNGETRGLVVKQESVNGELVATVNFKVGGGRLDVRGGKIGALVDLQNGQIQGTVDQLDKLAGNLIFELNKLHASGQGLQGVTSATATNVVADTTVALADPKTGLAFQPVNGSFVVHVTDKTTGQTTSTLVQIDLDGQGADTTLDDLTGTLDGIANVSASVVGGKLTVKTDASNYQITFSQDSSGTLAALGVNTFFSGTSAGDIALNQAIKSNPSLIAAAKNGQPTDNQTALGIAALQTAAIAALNGTTLADGYAAMINQTATSSAAAKSNADAAGIVRQTLESQRESLSGVSLDEEAVNLMKQQRAFQGAARLISAIDEMMKTVLQLI